MSDNIKNQYRLCLLEDQLEADLQSAPDMPPANRIVYQVEGRTTVNYSNLITDNVWFGYSGINLATTSHNSRIWRFELLAPGQSPAILSGDGLSSSILVNTAIDTVELDENWLMRCDSVAFPIGGCAYTHTHQGPGIRIIIDGAIRIDSGGHSEHYSPGEAWFESGPEAVFAQASESVDTRFIRAMLVPPEFEGKSTIQYVREEDLGKPKLQTYRKYCETKLDLSNETLGQE